MKKLFVLVAAATVFMSACNTAGSGKLNNEMDSVAYCVGLDLGNYIKTLDSTLNINMVAAGIKDVLKNKPNMTNEQAVGFLREYFMVRKPAKDKEASAEWLSKIEKETKGIQKTESGLLYVIETEGTGMKAMSDNDQVRVKYKGMLPNGTVFDSSYERGDTTQFGLNQVIRGWAEGMKLIGEGGKIKMWLPSELAYGEQGAGQKIAPNQPIVFEVELLQVIPAPAEEAAPEVAK